METKLRPFRWQASRIGEEANRFLRLSSFGGTVLAVLSKSIYLAGRDGEIFWVSKEALPMHRRSISVSYQAYHLHRGQRFWVSGTSLLVGEEMVVDLDRAEEWKPFYTGSPGAGSISMVNDRMARLLSHLQRSIPDSGLGQAIPILSAIAGGRELEKLFPEPLFNLAIPSILAITKACLSRDIVRVARAGKELIGLGSGLTPSGDDYLGGLFFALHGLKKTFPKEFLWDDQPVLDLLHWSLNRTHPISHAMLSDLSSGHGPEPLYDIFDYLLSGGDWNKMLLSIDQLCRMGQTSGWDILAGLLTGMLVMRGRA